MTRMLRIAAISLIIGGTALAQPPVTKLSPTCRADNLDACSDQAKITTLLSLCDDARDSHACEELYFFMRYKRLEGYAVALPRPIKPVFDDGN